MIHHSYICLKINKKSANFPHLQFIGYNCPGEAPASQRRAAQLKMRRKYKCKYKKESAPCPVNRQLELTDIN